MTSLAKHGAFFYEWIRNFEDTDVIYILPVSKRFAHRGQDMFRKELEATVPREILECAAVSREINFTSQEKIRQFRLEQRVFLEGACIEGMK